MMKRFSIHNTIGDTIVEVLVVLAVLGLAFSISYATANHATLRARNSEEHSEALGILKSQVDLARAAVAKGIDPSTLLQSFCISDPANPQNVQQFTAVPASAATDDSTNYPNYPAGCVSSFYHVSGTYDSSSNIIDFRVRWTGIGKLGPQQEELTYRIYKLTAGGSGIGLGDSPPQIKVVVRSISSTTPCASASGGSGVVGTTVSVVQTAGPYSGSSPTDGSGTAAFQNLIQGGLYTASIGTPPGFTACSGPQSVVIGTADVTEIDFYLQSNRIPLYRYYGFNAGGGSAAPSYVCTDHFYAISQNDPYPEVYHLGSQGGSGGTGPPGCYNYEGIEGYVMNTQPPGSLPFYRLYNAGVVDHFYTTDITRANDAVNLSGYTREGNEGYLYPYDGANCTTHPGTAPFYEWYSSTVANHVYVLASENPNNYSLADGGGTFTNYGAKDCIFTSP